MHKFYDQTIAGIRTYRLDGLRNSSFYSDACMEEVQGLQSQCNSPIASCMVRCSMCRNPGSRKQSAWGNTLQHVKKDWMCLRHNH